MSHFSHSGRLRGKLGLQYPPRSISTVCELVRNLLWLFDFLSFILCRYQIQNWIWIDCEFSNTDFSWVLRSPNHLDKLIDIPVVIHSSDSEFWILVYYPPSLHHMNVLSPEHWLVGLLRRIVRPTPSWLLQMSWRQIGTGLLATTRWFFNHWMPLDLYVKLGPYKFSLQASVDHHGYSMNSGHYTASINFCGKTFHCNDNKITACSITNTYNSSTAYILLYKLIMEC